ncbi:MAG: efflux RND transporter periplasmic adaptor subunit [bacterium]|nr:efflux RND transporter periplasmic adaptor subunit [bacterium]
MKRRFCKFFGSFFFIVLFVSACTNKEENRPIITKGGMDEGLEEREIRLVGEIFPIDEIVVKAPLTGKVTSIIVEEGVFVRKGQLLLAFETDLYAAELDTSRSLVAQARARLDAKIIERLKTKELGIDVKIAQARVESTKVISDNASKKLERAKKAYERQVISRQELEDIENEYVRASAEHQIEKLYLERVLAARDEDIQAARTTLQEAKVNLQKAQADMKEAMVRAPVSGFITDITVHKNEKVYEGSPLLTIVDISKVFVEAKISPGLVKFVKVGQNVEVVVNTVPPTKVSTTVHSVTRVASSEDGMCKVKAILPNPNYNFQPGYTAKIKIFCVPGL